MHVAFVLLLLVVAVVVLATERVAVEVFSLLLLATLAVSGVLTPQQTFAGLASPAVVMIAGIMLLTGALVHNGAAEMLARQIRRYAGGSEGRMGALLLTAVSMLSSVINNVAATAVFVPVAEGMARRFRVDRSRYLMSIAFASMTGGMCTLIGTSTNVAVAGALPQFGLEPLGVFELTPVGLLIAAVAVPYLLLAPRLAFRGEVQDPATAYGLRRFLYEVAIEPGAVQIGRSIAQFNVGHELTVLALFRGGERIVPPHAGEVLRAGDLLLVEGAAETIVDVQSQPRLTVRHVPERGLARLASSPFRLVEATVSYNSPFIGRTLKELNFRRLYDLSVLALHRGGEAVLDKVGKVPLRAGDVLLIHGRRERFEDLPHEPTRLLIESLDLPARDPGRVVVSGLVLGAAVLASAAGWLDAATAFLAGGALVLALKCLPADVAGSYLNVRFLVMVAAMASLGLAMETSGAARVVADRLIEALGSAAGPRSLLAVFFLLTAALTQPLSNAAAALLVLPIGIHAAELRGFDPRALAVAITLAASCSFITPFEPACLLVYGTGRYRFLDFVRVGTPLTLICLALCILVVPLLWPFGP